LDRILLNELSENRKFLENCHCLIIDEVHERTINTDILLGLIKKISSENPSLKIIITSATLDENLFKRYFKNN